jgi:ribosomal protein S19
MSRSTWKNAIYFSKNIKKLIIWNRGTIISSKMLGKPCSVYTGKNFKRLYLTRDKIGYSFGDFCRTRKYTKKTVKLKNKV